MGPIARCCCFALLAAFCLGCASSRTSHTARTATEQVLLSNAIDQTLENVSFEPLGARRVFIDDKYLDAVDKGYVIGTLRHKTLAAGGWLAKNADEADVVIEPRSGGVGTDSEESFVGIPALSVPGMPISLPDVKFISRNTQLAMAKLALVAYEPKTGAAVGLGGQTTGVTQHDDMYVLGMGPFRSGAVKQEREGAIGYVSNAGTLAAKFGQKPAPLAKHNRLNLVDGEVSRIAELPQASPDESLQR